MAEPLFPADFLWGAATSAYQIEGSPLADGAGPSIWHRFAHTPGRVAHGDTGDVACDHYRRWAEDVALIAGLGLNAYRFSISWSRVLPEGSGRVNEAGLDFYRRLVDRLREAGIEPMATLFHWDLPAALDDRGGWLNPDSPRWFADYARRCFEALDERVRIWSTLNEPWVVTDGGYLHGVLAPGHAQSLRGAARRASPAPRPRRGGRRLSRGRAPSHRAGGQRRAQVPGERPAGGPGRGATRRRLHEPALHSTRRSWAAIRRSSPRSTARRWPRFAPREVEALRQPIDFLGVNYYTRGVVRTTRPTAIPPAPSRCASRAAPTPRMSGRSTREGLRDTLLWLHAALRRPAALRHRERRRLLRPAAGRRRRGRGSAARRRICATTCAPSRQARSRAAPTCAATSPGRCSTTSSGARASEALRHRPRGLRDAAAHPQGERPLPLAGDREPRSRAARLMSAYRQPSTSGGPHGRRGREARRPHRSGRGNREARVAAGAQARAHASFSTCARRFPAGSPRSGSAAC